MLRQPSPHDRRVRLDALLTELTLYAKALCPEAEVEASALQDEDEDGRVEVCPPRGLPEGIVNLLKIVPRRLSLEKI